jgi:hypothetical protein
LAGAVIEGTALFMSLTLFGLGAILKGLPILFDDSTAIGQAISSLGTSLLVGSGVFLGWIGATVITVIGAIIAGLTTYWQNALYLDKYSSILIASARRIQWKLT